MVDVKVTADVPLPPADPFYVWRKKDHCLFEEPTRVIGPCQVLGADRNATVCVNAVKAEYPNDPATSVEDVGVNVVPYTKPATAIAGYQLDKYCDIDALTAQNPTSDSFVCFGVQARPREPENGALIPYEITTQTADTDDPVFYSSCLVRSKAVFASADTTSVVSKWKFGEQCLSCANRDANMDVDISSFKAPAWAIAAEGCLACNIKDKRMQNTYRRNVQK